jgi:anti-sigma regulatory factor (Ser/Thr protein kinase)
MDTTRFGYQAHMSGPDASVTSRQPPGPTVDSVLELPFRTSGLRLVREAVAAHADAVGVPGPEVGMVVLVASELAANALRHGGGAGQLRLWRDGTVLYCQVVDHGPGIAGSYLGESPPDPGAVDGRGLWICRQLSSGLLISGTPGAASGTTVTALFHLPPHEPHAVTRSTVGRTHRH